MIQGEIIRRDALQLILLGFGAVLVEFRNRDHTVRTAGSCCE